MSERRMNCLPELTEKQIGQQIVEYLKITHIPVWRMNTGVAPFLNGDGTQRFVRFGEKGFPDFLIAVPVNNIWSIGFVEVKSKKGKLTPEQELFKQYAEEQGMCYVLARSVADVQNGIGAYRKRFE